MSSHLTNCLRWFLSKSRLDHTRVRVRRGLAAGAKWTLFPFSSYWRGTHEPEIQAAIQSIPATGSFEGWSCWDLGAHFGLYSVGLAQQVGAHGEVAAFEPDPVSFERLSLHRSLNRLDWLKIFNAAASDHTGNAEIYTYGDSGSTTTHLPYPGEQRVVGVGALTVKTVALDDLVAQGQIRLPHFVKIDVEGHGHSAVYGMRQALSASRPTIIMAFHSEEEIAGTLNVLRPLSYRWEQVGQPAVLPQIKIGFDYLFRPGG